MADIPAEILRQLLGLKDYEMMLAADRIAKEYGVTSEEVLQKAQFVNTPLGGNVPTDSGISLTIEDNDLSIFNDNTSSAQFIADAHRYRMKYDPSEGGKSRQENVQQAIVCPHCNAALGIPAIRPIKVKCPNCKQDATFMM